MDYDYLCDAMVSNVFHSKHIISHILYILDILYI